MAFCAFLVGASKTGLPGLGTPAVPLMALLVGDARQSAGWLLPILCAADLFAIFYYRQHAAARRLFSLAPWVVVGMGFGAWALRFPEPVLRVMVGVIIFCMLGLNVVRMRRGTLEAAGGTGAALYGSTAGFATTVANAAGPVMSVYLLSKRLPKEDFVATGAWFFFVVNLSKVPIYAYHGLFSARSLQADALLLPAVAVGALAGRMLVRRISQAIFEYSVLALTAAATLALLFK